MPWIEPETVATAKGVDLFSYRTVAEPGNIKRCGQDEWRLKDHDSLKVSASNGKWHWHSRSTGGTTAVQYLIVVRGYAFLEAVQLVLDSKAAPYLPLEGTEPPKPFALPPRHNNDNRVVRYLCGQRGISREVVEHCRAVGTLYESAHYHSYGIGIVSMIASIIALVVAVVATISSNYNAEERVFRWLLFSVFLFVMFGSIGLSGMWIEGVRYTTQPDALWLVLMLGSVMAIVVLTWARVRLGRRGAQCFFSHSWNKCNVCSKCGAERGSLAHQYEEVPDTCTEQCVKCGAVRSLKHQYLEIASKCQKKCVVCGDILIEHRYEMLPDKCEKRCARCGEIIKEHHWRYEERAPDCNGCSQCIGDINNYGRLGCQQPMVKMKVCIRCGAEERTY